MDLSKIFLNYRQKLNKGFSLVEIMVVIAIIALMAAISIPNMLRTKLSANEKAAQTILKEVSKACESYRVTQPVVSYPATVADLTTADPSYCDASIFLANGFRGYVFSFTAGPAAAVEGIIQTFDCGARPATANVTGVRWFVIDETGVLREDLNADGMADASDPAIEE
ncbi:MAG: prepilin-type N-terminal cleavage/methylation domain-containing protein [Candidatus Omnitrophota bacterium]